MRRPRGQATTEYTLLLCASIVLVNVAALDVPGPSWYDGRVTKDAPKAGQRFQWRRLITAEDIAAFAELSGDKGPQHLAPDAQGRLMAHGLLTATLPTKIGGDLGYMARTMHFEFVKAVYAGDALTCSGVVESVIAQSVRLKVRFSFEIVNQRGEQVLKGSTAGMIPLAAKGAAA